MDFYTAARIEIVMFSAIAFGAGYYWPDWPGLLLTAFLVWAGIVIIKDEWDERRNSKQGRLIVQKWAKRFGKKPTSE